MKLPISNRKFFIIPFEALVWAVSLAGLAFMDVDATSHVKLCPLALMGIDLCPGCGLGRSISLFFSGRILESFLMHPFGIPALFTLIYRIIILFSNHNRTSNAKKSLGVTS